MTARAMWKGVLRIGDASVPVKLYSAIEDRDIHFRLLHATDLVPVTQAMVNPRTDEIVPHDQTQRGYAAPEGGLVIVQPDELAALTPQESRDIEFTRFVPIGAIDPQWYDRPYYLGPDDDNGAYSALTAALGRSNVEGVAHWVMRKKAYVGALRVYDGVLVLVSLRHEGEVVAVDSLETISGPALDQERTRDGATTDGNARRGFRSHRLSRRVPRTRARAGRFESARQEDEAQARQTEAAYRRPEGGVGREHRRTRQTAGESQCHGVSLRAAPSTTSRSNPRPTARASCADSGPAICRSVSSAFPSA